MQWSSFSGEHVEALAQATGFPEEPRERDCPACGERSVRAYLSVPAQARRPTLVTYVWCAGCRRFVGTRAACPDGLTFTDPLAELNVAQRRDIECTVVGFLGHLDRLWDEGLLPQRFR